jgi:type IV secretion system protein VirD4
VSSLIPNLLTWQGSMVVVDPKGENTAITARHRHRMGQTVHVIDPWGITGMHASRFNPLLWLDPDSADVVEDAMLLADSLVVGSDDPEDTFWAGEAKAFLAGLILHIITTEPRERRHLGTLREFLTFGETEFDWLIDDMRANHAAYGLVARAADRLMQKAKRERSGVISSAQAQTHILDSPRMVSAMCASDFDLAHLKRGAMTLYLVLPADRLATHGRWLRLMISLSLAALTRERMPPRRPVLFMLDEFAALGRLESIETAMGLLAGYGVQLWPVLQDLAQLEDLYPKRWRSFLANAGAIQAFGVNDEGTAEYLSALLGTRTATVRQRTRPGSGAHDEHQGQHESYSAVSRPLLMPHEILQMPPDKQLVFLQGQPPIFADKVRYYADKEFEGMFDPNPMVRR